MKKNETNNSDIILSKLEYYYEKQIFVIKYFFPAVIILLPIIILLTYAIDPNIFYTLMVLLSIGLIFSFYFNFKVKKLRYKCWYQERIFEKSKSLMFYQLVAAEIALILLLIILYLILKLFSEIQPIHILMAIFINTYGPLMVYISNRMRRDLSHSKAKYFKIRAIKLEDIVENSLNHLKLVYKKKLKRSSKWKVKPTSYYIEGENLNVIVFIENGVGIRFNPVKEENRILVQKIQKEIDKQIKLND
jgi:hypothetical protein